MQGTLTIFVFSPDMAQSRLPQTGALIITCKGGTYASLVDCSSMNYSNVDFAMESMIQATLLIRYALINSCPYHIVACRCMYHDSLPSHATRGATFLQLYDLTVIAC